MLDSQRSIRAGALLALVLVLATLAALVWSRRSRPAFEAPDAPTPRTASSAAPIAGATEVPRASGTQGGARTSASRGVRVPASSAAAATVEPAELATVAPPPAVGVTAELGAVQVHVRRADLSPVDRAAVVLAGPEPRVARVDAHGAVLFEALPPGRYLVGVDAASLAPGFALKALEPLHSAHLAQNGLPGGQRAVVIAGEVTRVELRVAPAGTLYGRVLGEGGSAAPGVDIWLYSQAGGAHHARATTDVDGFYELQLPAGGFVAVPHRRPGLDAAANWPADELVVIGAGQRTELDFSLAGGSFSAYGRIVDERGTPFANLDVHLFHHGAGERGAPRVDLDDALVPSEASGLEGQHARATRTNALGEFQFDGLRNEALRFEPGYLQGRCGLVRPVRLITPSPANPRIDMGTLAVERLPFFTLQVTLDVDPSWRALNADARIDWHAESRSATGVRQELWPLPAPPYIYAEPTLTWSWREPSGQVELLISSTRGEHVQRVFAARPGAFVEERIAFP